MQVKVGFGSVDMKGTYEPYGEVDDEPMSQAMVVDDGRDRAAWIMGDWYNWTVPGTVMLRKVIEEETGFAFQRIFICSSENHNSAAMHSKIDEGQAKVYGTRMAESVKMAAGRARPAWMALGVADVGHRYSSCRRKFINDELGVFTFYGGSECHVEGDRLNITRPVKGQIAVLCSADPYLANGGVAKFPAAVREYDSPVLHGELFFDRPVDNLVHLLAFRDANGESIGSIIRFSAHVGGGYNEKTEKYRVTAGYPGWARRMVERELGGTGAFILGCQGDLMPLIDADGGGRAEVKKIGEGLASEALAALRAQGDQAYVPVEKLKVSVLTAEMPLRPGTPVGIPEGEKALARATELLATAVKEKASMGEIKRLVEYKTWCFWVMHFHYKRYDMTEEQARRRIWPVEVCAMALNNVVLAGMVAEPGVQTSLRLRGLFGDRILTISECNGDIGYMVPEDDIGYGGYEATLSIIAQNGETVLRAAAAKAIAEVLSA